jgi:hypothetical protein
LSTFDITRSERGKESCNGSKRKATEAELDAAGATTKKRKKSDRPPLESLVSNVGPLNTTGI